MYCERMDRTAFSHFASIALVCVLGFSPVAHGGEQGWEPWANDHFLAIWGAGTDPSGASMSLIEYEFGAAGDQSDPVAINFDCPEIWLVGLQTSDNTGLNLGSDWDAYGELVDAVILPILHDSAYRSYTVFDSQNVEHIVAMEEFWVAGTLIGTTGEAYHITALVTAVTVSRAGIDDVFGTVFLTPDRVWSDIASAVADIEDMHGIYLEWEERGTSIQRTLVVSPPINNQGELLAPHCLDIYMAENQECFDEIIGNSTCESDRERDKRRCKTTLDGDFAAANLAYENCLDDIGLREWLQTVCLHVAVGSATGAGIGACFALKTGGISIAAGGALGGCAGLVTGTVDGTSADRAKCRRKHALDKKIALERYGNCLELAWADHMACIARDEARYQACMQRASDRLTRCMLGESEGADFYSIYDLVPLYELRYEISPEP